jgi:tetratricopeptide (TPR) repeat protein
MMPMPPPSLARIAQAFAVLCCVFAVAASADPPKPYVEEAPRRSFHLFNLFNRPAKTNPADQWAYVQELDARGKTRAAAKQALALRLFWPYSPEAPEAQLRHARLLERRNRPKEAFDAYQFLVEHYPGQFEFNEIVQRQMDLAKSVMERRRGKFLFLPGFTAPEHAIPLLSAVATNAPEWSGTAEAYYLIGAANQRIFEFEKAIDAYFVSLNRFPGSEFAEPSAFAQVQCHVEMAREAPQDNRLIETALAACDIFLLRFPDSSRRPEIAARRDALAARQIQNAFDRATYYDRILRQPESAAIEYRAFLDRFPDAPQAELARQRLDALAPTTEDSP